LAKDISGIICALITPRGKDGSVSKEGVSLLVDHLIEKGVDAIFPTGSAGEGPVLSKGGKEEVIASVMEAVDGRVPVLPGIPCNTTDETIALGRFCDDLGVDAVVVVTPWYYRLPDDALLNHYAAIAGAVESPIIVYKIPQATVNDISLDLLGKLAEIDGIVAMKDSSGDMTWFSQAITYYGDRLKFYGGNDRMILPCLSVGASGHVSGSANCFPKEVVDIYDSFRSGDIDSARRAQHLLLRKLSLLRPGKENSTIREILRASGIETGEALSPYGILTEEERRDLRGRLA